MKKLLLVALAVGLISSSSMAWYIEGTVSSIKHAADGRLLVSIVRTSDGSTALRSITADNAYKKEFLAMLLTAQSTNAITVVNINAGGQIDLVEVK